MKHILTILTAMALLFTSCSKVENPAANEEVQVSFRADLEYNAGTKAGGELSGYKVVCAVFDGGEELPALREVVEAENGSCVYTPRLIKGKTYNVVFWAMKVFEGSDNGNNGSYASYDVTDLKSITRTDASIAEADFDAFTAVEEITVTGATSTPVTLKRPLAKLNLGVTEADWIAALNTGLTPSRIEITANTYAFNALTNSVTGEAISQTVSVDVTGETMTVQSVNYKKLSSSYLFANGNVNLKYQIFGKTAAGEEKKLMENTIAEIPVNRNFNTNIVGNFMSTQVSFNIELNQVFEPDQNTEI